MRGDLLIGIDVGTTAVKGAVFDLSGREILRHASHYPTRRSGDRVEQDPADWMERIAGFFEGIRARGLAGRIAGIGITSQVNTHVFVDADGRPLAPAIVWQDGRCAEAAAGIDARISDADRLTWWGAPLPVDASHCLARMGWMAAHAPDDWERTHAVLLPKDYVLLRLAGVWASDPVSNIGLVDLDLRYIPELLDLVPGSAARLPALADPLSVAGEIRLPGAPRPVPVALGLMDAWAGMFGTGAHRDGDATYLSGTSEILGIISPEAVPEPGVLVFPRYAGVRLHAGPTQSGGASVDWACQLLGTTPDAMASLVGARRPDAPVPLFLPHLAGERAPLWDAGARGAFFGLAADTGPAELAQGVYEGVAMSVRLLLESLDRSAAIRPETLLCGGGGFRSDPWNQTRADILGRRLRRLAVPDPGVLGAAAIGAVACGLQPDLDAALADIVRYDRDYEPDAALQAFYDDLFALYLPAYGATRSLSHALAGLRTS